MENTWTVVFLVVGVILLAVGVIWGYSAYTAALPQEHFMAAMALAFVGFILILIGFAMGMGTHGSGSE